MQEHTPGVSTSNSHGQIYVWDSFVRLFHWSLVAAFTVAYLTEKPLIVHAWAGYVAGALILARVIWGFIGPHHARFSDFVYSPAAGLRYVRELIAFRAPRYLGHSPAGGVMVLALLVFVAATVVTGLVVYGGEHEAGPLAGAFSEQTGEAIEELHGLIANITLALIFFHIVGVALASFTHHENLVRAMITGYKHKTLNASQTAASSGGRTPPRWSRMTDAGTPLVFEPSGRHSRIARGARNWTTRGQYGCE
jgi:cytochrome b